MLNLKLLITIIGKTLEFSLIKERLFVYNVENKRSLIEEFFQWNMGSYQTESLYVST
jgi:hypothetical protein